MYIVSIDSKNLEHGPLDFEVCAKHTTTYIHKQKACVSLFQLFKNYK